MRIKSVLLLLALVFPLFAADDDPQKLVAKLRTTKDTEELERVVERIATVGDADGSSTAAVKKYLVDEATPKLEAIAADTKLKWSLRGAAIHALRDIGAPRAVLVRVAEMALKDSNEYVQSRGEILKNYVDNMPAEDEAAAKPLDPEMERDAIAFLKERNLGVSLDQLRISSIEAEPEEVQALIDAGVDVNGGNAADSPLNRALSACAHQGGENDKILETLRVLLDSGADPNKLDDNKNNALISAAQYCSDKAVLKLIEAGAEVNATNGSGINPLTMALIMSKLDAAEALVSKGARLTADQATMVSGTATDERAKAILKKATTKKK